MQIIKQGFIIIAIFVLLIGCSKGNFELGDFEKESVENAEVINTHGSIKGLEKMELFYQNTVNHLDSKLRVVHYTIEGDPIITNLSYDGEIITVQHDSTRDQYGSGSISTFSCNKFYKEVNPTNLSYGVSECKGNELGMDEILFVGYDMKPQDLFEIQLLYGEDLENEINTIDKNLTKVLSNDTVKNISDFDLPSSIKKEIYKRLVLANYLELESLDNRCKGVSLDWICYDN